MRPYLRDGAAPVPRLNRWDVLLPAGLAALGATELAILATTAGAGASRLELVACTAPGLGAGTSPWSSRRCPRWSLLLFPTLGPQLDEPATPILILAVGVYSLGRWIDDLRGLVGVGGDPGVMLGDYIFVDPRDHDCRT